MEKFRRYCPNGCNPPKARVPRAMKKRDQPAIDAEAAKKAAALTAVYWVVSESLRVLFPPRNLVPVP